MGKLQSKIKSLHGAGGSDNVRLLAEQAIAEVPSLAQLVKM